MGNTLKLVSGFVLLVIGGLIVYEASVYNLIDILLMIGALIAIVGILLVVSYFLDSNADRTTNAIKDFLNSNEFNASSLPRFDKITNNTQRPLNVRKGFNEYDPSNFEELVIDDRNYSSQNNFFSNQFADEDKTVLNVVNNNEDTVATNKQLNFTPNYDKPLKVTRAPKRREDDYFDEEIPEIIVETNKSENIKKALSQDDSDSEFIIPDHVSARAETTQPREIKIDVNNPESLPVPKVLKSFVIDGDGLVTSQEAFEQLAIHVNKEIMLEIPSLNDLSDRFLSHVPTIYSRVIINEFDVSDMSYMFLISSLLKQGVHIRTVPKVHSVNLITDDSHAMIISEGKDDLEYGAIYDDRNSISSIRADFEKTWSIASNLDDKIIMESMEGVA